MNIRWSTKIIDPKELIQISRGDNQIIHKYLQQFETLIPQRIESLQERLKTNDRKQVRQLLHQMSPQLQFFGIPDIIQPIRRLEHEYETMPIAELQELIDTIVVKLNLAIIDVATTLKENF
ncbi:MAG: HPt (histidine-containing phosphotransfer) domain-containing protein [Patiriisocius sp.]|jgi:HPt (histidine-containing phosphotransfer) domain-containing protein